MSLEPDFDLAHHLIEAGLLQQIDSEHVKNRAPTGAVLIACGDKDRFRQHFGGCSGIIDVHSLCLNGGGALLADGVDPERQRILLEDCEESLELKELRFVFSLAHFPCGKCTKLGITFRETVLNTLRGKDVLKKHIGKHLLDGVLPLISIDWRDAHMKQEQGVKLYAVRRQDAHAIKSFHYARTECFSHDPPGHPRPIHASV